MERPNFDSMRSAPARLRFLVLLALAMSVVLTTSWDALAQSYTLTDLGTLGGGFSQVHGLNNFGQVIGLAQNNTRYQEVICEWDPRCDFDDSRPHCWQCRNEQRDNPGRPFLWTPTVPNGTEGAMIDLGAPVESGRYGVATAISESGWVIGEADVTNGCFAWVPVLPNSNSGSLTNCIYGPISLSGQLLGLLPWWSLGTLPGYSNTIPLCANTNGQVVGYSFNPSTNILNLYEARAFLFTVSAFSGTGAVTSRIDLGALPGFTNTVATSINNHGQVVGFSSPDPFVGCGNFRLSFCIGRTQEGMIRDSGAFIWDSARGLRKLTSLIQGAPGVDFFEVHSINDAGQIAGTAWIPAPTHQDPNGRSIHAVLLTPKPASRLTLTAGQPGGQFRFTLEGEAGRSYTIQASTDLANWTSLTNFVSATGTNQFIDTATPGFNRRFYRTVTP